VLCDRVAILKRGRLAQVGHLEELRQRTEGPNRMEILATGAEAAALKHLTNAEISATPRGLRIEIASEDEIKLFRFNL
jgi:ABC-type multidrug transport system ATPase subunit